MAEKYWSAGRRFVSVDPNNLGGTARLTFSDDFNSLSLWNGSSGTWATTFWYQDPATSNGASLPSNGEQEWYINASYGPTQGVAPWTVDNGVLTITASPTPSWLSGQVNNYSYISGELNTYHAFAQTYGYFEMRAELPAGQGFWPAFWLMPENGAWPPELDVVETLGQSPTTLVTTSHSAYAGMESLWTPVPDTSAGYHTYGVDWEPDYITWYFDGQEVYQLPTPADMNSPMFIIANLAVGGNWPGPADGYSSAQMHVDYIRAYEPDSAGASSWSTPSPPALVSSTVSGSESVAADPADPAAPAVSAAGDVFWQNWAQVSDGYYVAPWGVTDIVLSGWNQAIQGNDQGDTFYSDDARNWLVGGAGADTFYLGRGGDQATGAGGADTFKFAEIPWTRAEITDFQPGDLIDLSAMFANLGYWSADPVADGRLWLGPDGEGGTQIWFNANGLSGAAGAWQLLQLDHVAPANLWVSGAFIGE